MIYTQQSNLPIIFQVDEGIILDVAYYLKRNNLAFPKVLVVSGKNHSFHYAKQIAALNNWINYTIDDNTFKVVEDLKNYINSNNIDLLIGVGGGKVIDTVKRASYLSNTNNLSIPTIISNDGLISPVAVIKNETGKTDSLPGMMPMGVIIDLDVIKESPTKYLEAAVGDVFSNLSATNDWVCAFKEEKERMNDVAFHLAKGAANSLVNFGDIDLKAKPFLRLLVQGLVNSGISMSLAGTSRPCSGSEHMLSHAIDFLGLAPNVLHGQQVGALNIFTLFLQNKLKKDHLKFAQEANIPFDFTSFLEDKSETQLKAMFHKAKEMRPGRYTILNQLTEVKFLDELKKFQKTIS
ncbi:iron-containing alcohol dehydrogenase [Aequorivita marina]|uniref:iron-containing alcohol dehydrogenase n=1 Tax=Aequorivita marina TaxID=3073654 RepID=UPI002875B8E7|nr:iron-containing alcohol dehydrogenase [Aequorivita sp. S2608]MDS1299083.1 iron-containing alcohol dehydrogenase [Aequorivita sp. S2608]